MFTTSPVPPKRQSAISRDAIFTIQKEVNSQIDRWITNASRRPKKRDSNDDLDTNSNKAVPKKDVDDLNATQRSNKDNGSFGNLETNTGRAGMSR